jgi:hypothetical protein
VLLTTTALRSMATEKKDLDVGATDVPVTKGDVDFVESGSNSSREIGFDAKQTKALVRKLDWALLPFLALLYLLSFLDRSTYIFLTRRPHRARSRTNYTRNSQHRKCSSGKSGGGPWHGRPRL